MLVVSQKQPPNQVASINLFEVCSLAIKFISNASPRTSIPFFSQTARKGILFNLLISVYGSTSKWLPGTGSNRRPSG